MAFDVDDCFELLLDARKEAFRYERCIRFFQFQTWIWYCGKSGIAPRDAGRVAAAAILRNLEEDYRWHGSRACGGSSRITLWKLEKISQLNEYSAIFDKFIAPGGGWSRLLYMPGPDEFDKKIMRRADHADYIADLIEYRLRATLNPPAGPDRSKITHAIFFKWRPNSKLVTARTLFTYWKNLKRTAVFIYLLKKCGFPMKPPAADSDDFLDHLTHPAISKVQLKRFFSEYQFARDVLGEEDFYDLPEVVKPVGFNVRPFSHDDLSIIGAYDQHYNEMNDPKIWN